MALVRPADRVAAAAAGIDQNLGHVIVIADDDDPVFTDDCHEEIARIGDLGVVAHEVPGAREDLFQFHFIDLLVREDPAVDQSSFRVHESAHFSVAVGDGHGHSPLIHDFPVMISNDDDCK